jgi:subtilisin family serine protease
VGVSPIPLAARVRHDAPGAAEAVARRLRGDPRVVAVERNRILHRQAATGSPLPASASDPPVNDPLYPLQAWHYAMIDLPEAWETTKGSSSVIVAVIDDGIRFDHPDIAGNLRGDGYDFVANDWTYDHCSGGSIGRSGDGDGYDPDPTIPVAYHWDAQAECLTEPWTVGGHGLHVGGTIGAVGNDGVGGIGVSPNVSIRPVRALDIIGAGTFYDIAQGVLYSAGLPADDEQGGTVSPATRAHVINLSLGGLSNDPVLRSAVEAAWEAGSLIVAAAGNHPNLLFYPAAYPEVISVSAVGPWATITPYSSRGSTIELAAPGGQTQFGCDFGVISTTWDFQTGQPGWHCHQGTSMAAPHVSGVAALLFAQEPGLSAAQVRARLRDWAVDLGDPDLYGYGLVNARNSLTRSLEPAGDVHVLLLDAASGEELARAPAAPDGSFEFRELDDADHLVFAGRDRDGDALVGVPGRRWGGFGGSADPGILTVDGAGTHPASFTIGFPLEAEPNDDFAQANRLVLGGYVRGIIDGSSDVDVFRVSIPKAGTYTFETSAVRGACGFALEEATVLRLYDGNQVLLQEGGAVDPDALNFCSRITHPLEPGDHFLEVRGQSRDDRRYQLRARAGG